MITFNKIFTYNNLYVSYLKCLKGVHWKQSVQNYEAKAIMNISSAYRSIVNGTYKSKQYVLFNIYGRGKTRECQSIHIYDRVIQKCLCEYCLIPLIRPKLIYTNSACLKNRGINFAKKNFKKHLKQCGYNGYCLQIDFKSYFDNIDHHILLNKLNKLGIDKQTLELINYLLQLYDKNKDKKGLALGSQMSQSFAIYYASEIDNYVYHYKNIKTYGRYMDDIYVFSKSKEKLKRLLANIEKIAAKNKIIINKKKTHIRRNKDGLVFLKDRFIITPSGKVLERPNNMTFYRMKKKINMKVVSDNDFKSWYGSIKKSDCKLKVQKMKQYYMEVYYEHNRNN